MRTGLFAICALAMVVATHAAQKSGGTNTAPTLVEIPVAVTDAADRLVSAIPPDRFRVYVDDRPQAVTRVSHDDRPASVAVVIGFVHDPRERGARHAAIRNALLHFAGSSHPDDQVILRVDQHARIASSWKAPDDNVSWFRSVKAREQETFDDILGPPLQPTAVASKIGHLWWSPLPRALFGGLRGLEHASMSRRILLFFNNGMESLVSTTTPIEVTEINGYSQLDDARKAGVEIYALGVFPSDAESVVSGYSTAFKPKAEPSALEKLASDTGGMAAVVDSEDSLMQAVDRIAREIRGAYTLAFESPTKDKQFHRVRVEITGPDTYTVRARPGYMAAK